jgi:hypothetical protein
MPKRHRPMSREVKFSFNQDGKCDRYYTLTGRATNDGYKADVNLRLEPQVLPNPTSQGSLGPSKLRNKQMNANKAV